MKLEFSGNEITRAGNALIQPGFSEEHPEEFAHAMEVLSYWRACHEIPLQEAVELLEESAKANDSRAIIGKRPKRTESIIKKLKRFDKMTLRNMHDIGGCRAIVKSLKRVRKIERDLRKQKNFRIRDYIKNPKDDGYRGIHLTGDFGNRSNGKRRIEIQLRTKLQHAWATAVEIVDLFTGQAIKSSQGSKDWTEFFRSAADQFAIIETISVFEDKNSRIIAGELFNRINQNRSKDNSISKDSNKDLYFYAEKLDAIDQFAAFAGSLNVAEKKLKIPQNGYALIQIDTKKFNLSTLMFSEQEFPEATDAYLQAEKSSSLDKNVIVALVSTGAFGDLKSAYPNYYADSAQFVYYIGVCIDVYKLRNPSSLGRAISKIFG